MVDRFAQIEPKVMLAVDGYRHGGKDFERAQVVDAILAELPTVEHVVLLPYVAADPADRRRAGRTPKAGRPPSRLLVVAPARARGRARR